ncbi:MAG TPA: tyrosine-type recombinase/integrase [Methylocella sp.]|jgi:integrase
MPRNVRNSVLETRSKRLRLPVARKPVFVRIGPGISLGYRRNQTSGTWVLRVADGCGGARTTAIGFADDHDEANGRQFLDFWQAQERAKISARRQTGVPGTEPLTVRLAAKTYLNWLTAKNARTAADTRGRLNRHFLPKLGDCLVISLTKTLLDRWLASMVPDCDDPDRVRRSKDSANRVLTMIKALLNHAMRDPSNGLIDDSAWRLVKPFHGVAKPRDTRYTDEEVRRLINGAGDAAVSDLITGAYLTGARYGELTEARVTHFDARTKTLRVNAGKTGARTIILQTSAVHLCNRLATGPGPGDFLFVRGDGSRWKRSDQTRPIKDALKKAGLASDGSIYALRHTYVSHAIEGGVPLNIIADNCGTSVRMIEKTYAKILAEKRRDFIERGAPSFLENRPSI